VNIQFVRQILIGDRTYGVGETAVFNDDDLRAKALIHQGVAVPAEDVREATAYVVKQARRATKRGKQREARDNNSPRLRSRLALKRRRNFAVFTSI